MSGTSRLKQTGAAARATTLVAGLYQQTDSKPSEKAGARPSGSNLTFDTRASERDFGDDGTSTRGLPSTLSLEARFQSIDRQPGDLALRPSLETWRQLRCVVQRTGLDVQEARPGRLMPEARPAGTAEDADFRISAVRTRGPALRLSPGYLDVRLAHPQAHPERRS